MRKSMLGPGDPSRSVSLESLGIVWISANGTSDIGFTDYPKIYLGEYRNLVHHSGVKRLDRLSRCEKDEQDSPRKQLGLLYFPFAIGTFLTR